MEKKIFNLFLFLFLVGMVSANGLVISNPTALDFNKTYNQDKNITIQIENQEPFDFYNLEIEENIASIQKTNLSSGQIKNITLTINTNENYYGELTLIGYYESNIGASNETYQVSINYENGFSQCDLNIIVGDSINWSNNVIGDIKLKYANDNEIFASINEGETYLEQFNYVQSFDYYASYLGFAFTNVCNINVLDDEGLVHNTEYDYKIDTKIEIFYEETSLTVNIPKINYEIAYNGQKSDIFTIENTGTKIAKEIHLEGEWFTFSDNDFDLAPGDSVNIGYTIKPGVFATEDTNKTYNKTIKVKGNFPELIKSITIFVPFSKIGGTISDWMEDPELVANFFSVWCKAYPEYSICQRTSLNGTGDSLFNFEISKSSLKELFDSIKESNANSNLLAKEQLETDKNQTDVINNLNNGVNRIIEGEEQRSKDFKDLKMAVIFLVILILFINGIKIIFEDRKGGKKFISLLRKRNFKRY